MLLPEIPTPLPSPRISPSLYEDLLSCWAKASWHIGGVRKSLPAHPAALLGTSFHGVLEAVHKAEITGTFDEKRATARVVFDRLASEAYENSHPLLRMKFPTPDRLPYYNQQRELAAFLAAETEEPKGGSSSAHYGSGGAERWFESPDGVIRGRPDFLDAANHEVIDYKTGRVEEGGGVVTDREKRQLALYAYLAHESGISVERGRIVRANGLQAVQEILPEDSVAEAVAARALLAEYNEAAPISSFRSLASPSPEGCATCDCKPLCEAFWNAADDDWQQECGTHVEGEIVECSPPSDVQGATLITVKIRPTRGTVISDGDITIPQIPLAWFTADDDRPPEAGDLVRLVEGRLVKEDEPVTVQGDRIMTTVWRVDGYGSQTRDRD